MSNHNQQQRSRPAVLSKANAAYIPPIARQRKQSMRKLSRGEMAQFDQFSHHRNIYRQQQCQNPQPPPTSTPTIQPSTPQARQQMQMQQQAMERSTPRVRQQMLMQQQEAIARSTPQIVQQPLMQQQQAIQHQKLANEESKNRIWLQIQHIENQKCKIQREIELMQRWKPGTPQREEAIRCVAALKLALAQQRDLLVSQLQMHALWRYNLRHRDFFFRKMVDQESCRLWRVLELVEQDLEALSRKGHAMEEGWARRGQLVGRLMALDQRQSRRAIRDLGAPHAARPAREWNSAANTRIKAKL